MLNLLRVLDCVNSTVVRVHLRCFIYVKLWSNCDLSQILLYVFYQIVFVCNIHDLLLATNKHYSILFYHSEIPFLGKHTK